VRRKVGISRYRTNERRSWLFWNYNYRIFGYDDGYEMIIIIGYDLR
jgi:hypothetical protein